jgi:hypothetical protein
MAIIFAASEVSEIPQPEIVTSPDGSESIFIVPGSSNDTESDSPDSSAFAQGMRPLLMGYYP